MAFTDNTTGGRTILIGRGKVSLTLAGTVAPGDPIGYNSGWVRADANGTFPAEFIAGHAGVSGDVITAYRVALIGGCTLATANDKVYLSDTAGGYSATTGTLTQIVGKCINATDFWCEPSSSDFPIAAKGSAYTQTYSTAHKTVADATVAAVAGTVVAGGTGSADGGWDTAAHRDTTITTIGEMKTSINALIADVLQIKKNVTALIDDLQLAGIVG